MNKERTRKEAIVEEYLGGKTTYRELSARYGCSLGTVHRWVKEAGRKRSIRGRGEPVSGEAISGVNDAEDPRDEIRRLRKELKTSELRNEFLSELIRIAENETGLDIRKKGGSRQR